MLKLNEQFRDNEDFNNCLLVNTNSRDLCLEKIEKICGFWLVFCPFADPDSKQC